jgi:hypothetical protein
MKITCTRHPEREPLLILRQWQLDFCEGNHCAAALLSLFEYWHNCKLNQCAQAGNFNPTEADLIQHHTTEQLRAGILELYDAKAIREARRLLVEKGVITECGNPLPRYGFDRTIHFVYHPEPVNAWLEARQARAEAERCPACPPALATIPAPRSAAVAEAVVAEAAEVAVVPAPRAARAPAGEPAGSIGENAGSVGETAASYPEITPELSKTTPPTPPEPVREGSGSGRLIFDFHLVDLPEEQRERAARMLAGLDSDLAQQVLDEWNAARGGGKVREPWAWLRAVSAQARQGTFIPTNTLPERRLAAAIQRESAARAREVAPPAAERRPSAIWTQCQEWLRDRVEAMDFHCYVAALRGREDGQALWLEAPNRFVADWIRQRLSLVEEFIRPQVPLEVRVCVG